jgi:WD40 repeat protein
LYIILKNHIEKLAFSNNSWYFATGGLVMIIRIYSIKDNFQLIKEINNFDSSIYSLQFSNDDTLIAFGGVRSFIRIYNFEQI